jgi:hypothetical protein
MPYWKEPEVERYLRSVLGMPVHVLALEVLGKDNRTQEVKGFGYGVPVKVVYSVNGEGARRAVVLHTMTPGPFGHEHMADRAGELLWEHQTFNRLPRHVRSLDVCGLQQPGGEMLSVGNAGEFCLLTEYVEGESYSHDLERIRETGASADSDFARAAALCDYLVDIHKTPGEDPELYVRRIRELVGSGECIMGIADSYPPHPLAPASFLERIEHLCVGWRWRLKHRVHRLRQVHGDFHPWNILFRTAADFSVLDRSRGEFGDPADDVTALTMNYVFFSLQRSQKLEGVLERLFREFWQRYLENSGDEEMLCVAAPFFAFRGLVMASPLWYPTLSDDIRKGLLTFVVNVLEEDRFDPSKVNQYCGV